jgi:hypothetical protein
MSVHTVKSKGKISQNFVAFSEYMNFKVKIILSKYSEIVIHKLLVKSLIVNNCVVGHGLTCACARFSM